jgi:phospholipid-binding lipoprotein MlaA
LGSRRAGINQYSSFALSLRPAAMLGCAMTFSLRWPAALALTLGLCACSTPSPESLAENDPWEMTNRDVFGFDVWVDRNVARPVAEGYKEVAPEPVREAVHNVVTNLHAPIVLANDVLQGDPDKALDTVLRIAINSTLGIGGLIDVASRLDIPFHDNDFGITLGQNDIAEGSYLVLPLLGPLPPRDLLGSVVDGAFDPLSYARFHGKDTWMFARGGARILDGEARRMDEVETIERTSLDFYATTRNLYRQSRNARIHGQRLDQIQLPDL